MKLSSNKNTFYDFYRDGVTQSFIDEWLRCPHQAKLHYVDGWTPKASESQAIVFGNACHHVLEKAYLDCQCPNPGIIKTYIAEFENSINYDELTSDEAYETEVTLAKSEAVMKGYFQYYHKDFENNWEYAEAVFKIPYEFPDGKKTFISGKLDGGFLEENNLWLMDHKCMGRIQVQNLLILLPVDIQVNTYLWCISQLNGKIPKGFKYNIIRNPQTKPHTRKDESLRDYQLRIQEDIEKRQTHYFTRISIPILPIEITQWYNSWLTPILRDIRLWWDSGFKWPEYYRTNNLKTEYGTLSPWAHALVEHDFSYYYKREHVFQELVT